MERNKWRPSCGKTNREIAKMPLVDDIKTTGALVKAQWVSDVSAAT